ncbi:hypothetical protein CXG81DRAFT_16411 [Caulochytrium protostelioides]|uniref:DUF1754-domain-containing protein n=1 Tax=Caulochytrium protostelioides TaxID=1555241 RepID=A0A4P9WVT1_9FUNG|nr:DUF1754-domain-containing protein [Caulochytrium protostelioides]RKP04127.1 hypothetical protein CXG81DRAFT_16411 [Caulochytrium protostelioides]|eukprot:RKP04127.1 hypothetical protein CXG81DRAFT_16411 [Caulochytrium protostelioides]
MDYTPAGGRLALKGTPSATTKGITKKKKKRPSCSRRALEERTIRDAEEAIREPDGSLGTHMGSTSPSAVSIGEVDVNPDAVDEHELDFAMKNLARRHTRDVPTKTPAELRFAEAQRKRLEEKTDKIAQQSHRERVQNLNQYLDRLSEHHDMPRVGPG